MQSSVVIAMIPLDDVAIPILSTDYEIATTPERRFAMTHGELYRTSLIVMPVKTGIQKLLKNT